MTKGFCVITIAPSDPGMFSTEFEIAMFSAYFDASVDKDKRIVTVAGFVSRLNKWERFAKEWMQILSVNPRVSYFHMTDFASSRQGWEEWNGKSEMRAKLVSDLVACIAKNTNKGFADTVATTAYEQANAQYMLREELGTPYAIAALACLGGLKKWALRKGVDYRRISVLLEEGDGHQYDLIRRARTEGYNAVPQGKQNLRMFDACDLAAWKSRTIVDDSFERLLWQQDPDSAPRILASLNQLEKAVHMDSHRRTSYESLVSVCQGMTPPISSRSAPTAAVS